MKISTSFKIFLFITLLIISSKSIFGAAKYTTLYFNPLELVNEFTIEDLNESSIVSNLSSATETTALDFDGADDYIDYGDESAFEFTSSFSIEAWVLQENTVSTGTILSKSNVKVGNEKGYKLVLNNNAPSFYWYDSTSAIVTNLISPYTINNNKWYHIAVTFDGTTARLYINGIEVINNTPLSVPGYSTENFIIGATYNSDTPEFPNDFFDGFIDEVKIWDVALSNTQIREMMNQEIKQSGIYTRGKIIPLDISGGLHWANLLGYYDMNENNANDKSSYSRNGSSQNMTSIQEQTAPLPYTTKADGNWSDNSISSVWTYGDTVWDAVNGIGIDGTTLIDWNIVVTNHNILIDSYSILGREIKVLGLIVNSNKLILNGNNTEHTGNGLIVTNYLKLLGNIDLEGESQLIQTSGSILDVTSSGSIERDQQGTKDLYTYNYWSSPVGVSNIISNNNSYTVPTVFKDGTDYTSPSSITFMTSGYNGTLGPPIKISDYWIWKYANQPTNNYSAWQHVRSTGSILAGESFTMKGVTNTNGNITLQQNYVFKGKPNNGNISLTLAANNDYLVGNPYPSAIDADEFIKDNISNFETNGNVINGVLYYNDHFASGTHVSAEYNGGYATYTLIGGASAINHDIRINATGETETLVPERYIPVGQGFFVSAILDASLVGLTHPVVGGNILFKNSQRIFKKEAVTGSNTGSVFLTSNPGSSKEKAYDEKSMDEYTDSRQKIRLMYDSPSGYHRELLVGIDENATNGFDLGYDAPLIENNKEDMYWQFNSNKFTIQAVNNFEPEQKLPFGFKTSKLGNSTIRIKTLENVEESTKIYIHDLVTDSYHDLRESNFVISLPVGDYTNRFEVTFSIPDTQGQSLGVSENELYRVDVYYSNELESIVLVNPIQIDIKKIELLNILGQSIIIIDKIEELDVSGYKVKNLSSGTYVLKMHSVSGSVSKKVLVK